MRKRKKRRVESVTPTVSESPKKFKESPMKGRKISLEDRGPDAKKLGRRFKFEEGTETERFVVTLNLRKGDMAEFLKRTKSKTKAEAICKIVERLLK